MTKKIVFYPAACGVLLCGLVLHFVFGKGEAQAQMSADAAPVARKAESVKTGVVAGKAVPAASTRFTKASAANARLQNSLRWTFGGRPQIGWSLYALLIGETIGSDNVPDSAEFAEALAAWQARSGIAETGILDKTTLDTFVKAWQSQRRTGGSRTESHLLSAPITEFYDPSRAADLLELDSETYAAYKRMIAAAVKDLPGDLNVTKAGELAPRERFLRIISAYRSPAYQAQLRKKAPSAGRAALALNSVHSTGRALDIYVGGEPVITKDANRAIQVATPAYKWLVKNAARFGFYPYFYEPWHWEYVPGK